MAGVDRIGAAHRRTAARPLPARAADRPPAPFWGLSAVPAQYCLCQYDCGDGAARISGRPGARATHRSVHTLERHGDGGAGEPQIERVRRPYLERRLSEEQLSRFRQEVGGNGLSSYPHPWLMPDFWQFPTVSMGLGPMMAIYQARFIRYLENRGLVAPPDRKVWAFCGDGEMDEPESMGALTMPVREGLDNLIFVVNCNLQRLAGPVRGNGKITQELEAAFLGAGWNVIKVIWGSRWDPLLARDTAGNLQRVMEECVDGEYQNFKAKGGAYT